MVGDSTRKPTVQRCCAKRDVTRLLELHLDRFSKLRSKILLMEVLESLKFDKTVELTISNQFGV